MKNNSTLGVVLIVIGGVWLLTNLNIFSFNIIEVFFRSLDKLWPLILIGIGSSLLLKKSTPLRFLVWLIILVVILLYGIYGINTWDFRLK